MRKQTARGRAVPAHAPFSPHAFIAPAAAPKPDKRPTTPRKDAIETVLCPACGAEVHVRHAWSGDLETARQVGAHRPGGGTVRVTRGDVHCKGEGMPA